MIKPNISKLPLLRAFAVLLIFAFVGAVARPFSITEEKSQLSSQPPTILIWKVGSPYNGATPERIIPPELQLEASRAGYQLVLETFPAQGFAQRLFDAISNGSAPDILAFDNYGIMKGTTTRFGKFIGIETIKSVRQSLISVSESFRALEFGRGGWEFLLSASRNHNAAKALALREPECAPNLVGNIGEVAPTEIATIKSAAVSATRAHLTCDAARLREISDSARLGAGCLFSGQESRVLKMEVCSVAGNKRLAFVKTLSSFEVPGQELGRKSILAVLRNEGSGWRLLAITDDKLIERLDPMISDLTRLLTNESDKGVFTPAALVTADGARPMPQAGQRFGDFLWHPSPAPEVVCEVIEFDYGEGARLLFSFKSPNSQGRVSEGQLFSTIGLWHWRVWSIARNGKVVVSETRTFK